MSPGQTPNTIYCGGLTKSVSLTHLHQHFARRQFSFTDFHMSNATDFDSYEDQLEATVGDIVLLIDRFYELHGQQNLFAAGLSAQAALRAASVRQSKVRGVALASPSVGVQTSQLGQLKVALPQHTLRSLMALTKLCPVNNQSHINLQVPVFVQHNINDTLVPYKNVLRLAEKLPAGKCHLLLTNEPANDIQLTQLTDLLLQNANTDTDMTNGIGIAQPIANTHSKTPALHNVRHFHSG